MQIWFSFQKSSLICKVKKWRCERLIWSLFKVNIRGGLSLGESIYLISLISFRHENEPYITLKESRDVIVQSVRFVFSLIPCAIMGDFEMFSTSYVFNFGICIMQYIRFAKITYSDLLYIFFLKQNQRLYSEKLLLNKFFEELRLSFSIAEFGNFRELISHDHRIYPQRVK